TAKIRETSYRDPLSEHRRSIGQQVGFCYHVQWRTQPRRAVVGHHRYRYCRKKSGGFTMLEAFIPAARRQSLLSALVARACVLAPPARAPAANADTTVFYDAQVFTAEPAHPYADAVAIRGDRILAVGPRAVVEQAAGADARKVDLGGRFLMPGM